MLRGGEIPHQHLGRWTRCWTYKNREAYKIASALSHGAARRQQHIKVRNPIFHIDRRSFGTCFQKVTCSDCWAGGVLTANNPLQGSNGIVVKLSSHTSKQTDVSNRFRCESTLSVYILFTSRMLLFWIHFWSLQHPKATPSLAGRGLTVGRVLPYSGLLFWDFFGILQKAWCQSTLDYWNILF